MTLEEKKERRKQQTREASKRYYHKKKAEKEVAKTESGNFTKTSLEPPKVEEKYIKKRYPFERRVVVIALILLLIGQIVKWSFKVPINYIYASEIVVFIISFYADYLFYRRRNDKR